MLVCACCVLTYCRFVEYFRRAPSFHVHAKQHLPTTYWLLVQQCMQTHRMLVAHGSWQYVIASGHVKQQCMRCSSDHEDSMTSSTDGLEWYNKIVRTSERLILISVRRENGERRQTVTA